MDEESNGRERDRTADLLVANEALSQLSYTPVRQILLYFFAAIAFGTDAIVLARLGAGPGRRK